MSEVLKDSMESEIPEGEITEDIEEKYLPDEKVNDLIKRIQDNNADNEAWNELCANFEDYITRVCKTILNEYGVDSIDPADMEDLHQAGFVAFFDTVKNYKPGRAKFTTYAWKPVYFSILHELLIQFNRLGITNLPKYSSNEQNASEVIPVSIDDCPNIPFKQAYPGITLEEPQNHETFSQPRRVLQILKVLCMLTDEDHSLNKTDLQKALHYYRLGKYSNDSTLSEKKGHIDLYPDHNTYTNDIEELLMAVDPLTHTEENDSEYLVKYSGYDEDSLYKKINKGKGVKSKPITDFSYSHIFDNPSLDTLIQLISFTDMISDEEKSDLIKKLVSTASIYYKTPFWDETGLRFNTKAVYGRFTGREKQDRSQFADNIKILQYALNNMCQVRFRFNRYDEENNLVPTTDYIHTLSPYRLVVYHDNYYCIGFKNGDERVKHYRVDLMSDIEIVRDENGKEVRIELTRVEALPVFNYAWDPQKYMSEHLYMAYDNPKNIEIKIRNTDYTIIHDWFGDNYEKVRELTDKDGDGNEVTYHILKVRTSPTMIVHWAMQYGTKVEIMDEEIREKISKEIEILKNKYV